MKTTYIIMAVLVLSIFGMRQVSASDPTIVTGIVYHEDSNDPAPGVSVDVSCNNSVNVTEKQDITDSTGMYAVEFMPDQCVPGNMVTICEGDTENCVEAQVTDTEFWKNIVYKSFDVPELSWTAAGLALIGATLGFLLLRKSK